MEKNDPDIDEITEAGFTSEAAKVIDVPRISESFLKLECEYEWEKELVPDSNNITICGRVKHISVSEQFVKKSTAERYGEDSFMFNLHNPVDPHTGEFFGSGVGFIDYFGELK